jgi:hypothetical protein
VGVRRRLGPVGPVHVPDERPAGRPSPAVSRPGTYDVPHDEPPRVRPACASGTTSDSQALWAGPGDWGCLEMDYIHVWTWQEGTPTSTSEPVTEVRLTASLPAPGLLRTGDGASRPDTGLHRIESSATWNIGVCPDGCRTLSVSSIGSNRLQLCVDHLSAADCAGLSVSSIGSNRLQPVSATAESGEGSPFQYPPSRERQRLRFS